MDHRHANGPGANRAAAATCETISEQDNNTRQAIGKPAPLSFLRLRFADALRRGDHVTANRLLPTVDALLNPRPIS